MLKVGVIGLGNAGNQVASLCHEKLAIDAIAINSSETDLSTITSDIPKKLIKCKDGSNIQGAGQNRDLAIDMLKDSVIDLVSSDDINELMLKNDVVFVISSSGGGTGSGTSPTMVNVLNARYPDTKVILIGIHPVLNSAGASIFNAKQYSEEVCNVITDITYMMYDNDKVANTKIPSYQVLRKVNEDIVEDIRVLMGYYNTPTPYNSIDDQDNLRLISSPGYMSVASIRNIHEKDLDKSTLEEMIIDAIKRSSHVDMQRDRIIYEIGIIYHLSENIAAEFNDNTPAVWEFIGTPLLQHVHTVINADKSDENYIMIIMTGGSNPYDHFNKFDDRIEEINAAQNRKSDQYSFNNSETTTLSEKMTSHREEKKAKDVQQIDLNDLFGRVRH